MVLKGSWASSRTGSGQALAWVYREWSFQKSTVVSKPQGMWCLYWS